MRLKSCKVVNFGSFKELEIDFSNLGLTLIHGATGAGKSTLLDAPCWILYGCTAKDGNVDEIKSWLSEGEATNGVLEVDTTTGSIVVTRIRGKSQENDLYWTEKEDGDQKHRGKDITETQILLSKRLGVSKEIYLTAAYFSEFSPNGTFFTSKAKDRRLLLENIAKLTFPTLIAENASETRKVHKKTLVSTSGYMTKHEGRLYQLNVQIKSCDKDAHFWDIKQKELIAKLIAKKDNFDSEKALKIEDAKSKVALFNKDLSTRIKNISAEIETLEVEAAKTERNCPTCGAEQSNHALDKIEIYKRELKTAKLTKNPYDSQLDQAQNMINIYEEQLKSEIKKSSPFLSQKDGIICDIQKIEKELNKLKEQVLGLEHLIGGLDQIYDLSFDLRGKLLLNTVKEIEEATNKHLENYFDSEIRVTFTLTSDELSVSIQKNGYECSYKQLSKGQRGLLKLCFSTSVMEIAANRSGLHFSCLFFDEALDGFDSNLKVKAFSLFEELSLTHESILLIDHAPEFQNLFNKRYACTISQDISTISMDE